MEGFATWISYAIVVCTSITKAILLLCQHKHFHVIICLDGMLVLINFRHAGKCACSLLVCVELHINFFKSELHLAHYLCF